MPVPASPVLPVSVQDALAPDLLALFLGATPHPDIVIPQPVVTVADRVAAARAQIGVGTPDALRWDASGQQLSL